MTILAIDIKDILVDRLGLVFAKDLFINAMPSESTDGVCIYDSSYSPAEETLDGEIIRNDGFQIICRGISYVKVEQMAQDIIDTLHGIANEEINGTNYMYIKLTSGPFTIPYYGLNSAGVSNKNKLQLSINFSVKRTD